MQSNLDYLTTLDLIGRRGQLLLQLQEHPTAKTFKEFERVEAQLAKLERWYRREDDAK